MKVDILNTNIKYKTILADPPWQYNNRTGKGSPEHKRLNRYSTMTFEELLQMGETIKNITDKEAHIYMWCTWPMIKEGIQLLEAWGFEYKTGIPWLKVAKDGTPDGRCMGFYGRVVTEFILFGSKCDKKAFRTKGPHNKKNVIIARKGRHSEKPQDQYDHIESKSFGNYIELFARDYKEGWDCWGDEV